jgi:hypothetical protein
MTSLTAATRPTPFPTQVTPVMVRQHRYSFSILVWLVQPEKASVGPRMSRKPGFICLHSNLDSVATQPQVSHKI